MRALLRHRAGSRQWKAEGKQGRTAGADGGRTEFKPGLLTLITIHETTLSITNYIRVSRVISGS